MPRFSCDVRSPRPMPFSLIRMRRLEDSGEAGVFLEIQFNERVKPPGEISDGRGLTRLPGSAQKHRLAKKIVLPFKEGRIYGSWDIDDVFHELRCVVYHIIAGNATMSDGFLLDDGKRREVSFS